MTPVLGLVGGIAPPSTVAYYQQIRLALYREQHGPHRHPPMVITSMNLPLVLRLLADGRQAELADAVVGEVARLERAGATFAVISSNSTHVVFEEVARRSSIPLISIVEVACQAAQRLGLRRPGLLGTRYVMSGPLYPRVFAPAGIEVLPPPEEDRATIHARYMDELVEGVFRPETRATFEAIARRLRDAGADGLILGGTEIPLLLGGTEVCGLPVSDTTRLHVEAIVERLHPGEVRA